MFISTQAPHQRQTGEFRLRQRFAGSQGREAATCLAGFCQERESALSHLSFLFTAAEGDCPVAAYHVSAQTIFPRLENPEPIHTAPFSIVVDISRAHFPPPEPTSHL